MIIDHPLLGPRDSAEFTYLGDASLIDRPDWQDKRLPANSMNISICGTIRQVNIRNSGTTSLVTAAGLLLPATR